MLVILGLVVLIAAVIAGVAGVLANGGHAHTVTHFAVFGYHVTGSTGTLFLYGIVVGALALAGLSVLLAGARRTSRRGRDARRRLAQSRRETAAAGKDRDDLLDQRERDIAQAPAAATADAVDPARNGSTPGRTGLFGRLAAGRPAPRHATQPEPLTGQDTGAFAAGAEGADAPAADAEGADAERADADGEVLA
jgi:hypothetical protein